MVCSLKCLVRLRLATPLTLLTLVGDGKLEYYGEIIPSTTSISSQISSVFTALLSLDIEALNTSEKNKKKLTKNLQGKQVTKGLEAAMEPEYWSNDNTLTQTGGDKLFKLVADAMKKIIKAKKEIQDETNDDSILVLLNTLNDTEAKLIESMRALAADRIAAAQAAKGNTGQIATARLDLTKGDAHVIAGKIDKAIKSYGDSWNELSGAF